MESIEFLKTNLSQLSEALSYLEIKYEYKGYLNTHIIEVKPIHCFEMDKEYIDRQISLENEFEKLYPNEEILFITENELISIENPLIELGVNQEECHYELIAPVKIEYNYSHFAEYHIDANLKNQFEIPESPPKKYKWRNPLKPKKTLKENQGFFV